MAPKLYMILGSPPVRAVVICAKALDLELELVEVDLFKSEHFSPEYLKLNPTHTVPTLVDDDGFVLYDSHAIMGYLVEKYGKDKSLYPNDLKKRTVINQKLHFDSSILFNRGLIISRSILFDGATKISPDAITSIKEACGFVENFLEASKWVAGDELSIADFSIATSITAWDALVPLEASNYPKIMAWLKQMERLPYYEAGDSGLEAYRSLVASKLSQ